MNNNGHHRERFFPVKKSKWFSFPLTESNSFFYFVPQKLTRMLFDNQSSGGRCVSHLFHSISSSFLVTPHQITIFNYPFWKQERQLTFLTGQTAHVVSGFHLRRCSAFNMLGSSFSVQLLLGGLVCINRHIHLSLLNTACRIKMHLSSLVASVLWHLWLAGSKDLKVFYMQ